MPVSKPGKPHYVLYQFDGPDMKTELDRSQNKYLIIQKAWSYWRSSSHLTLCVVQRRWPHKESPHDAVIATFGEHIPYSRI